MERTFHRPFWPPTETGGSNRKGKEQARTRDYNKSIKTRLFLCVRKFAWEIQLDLDLADRESGAWDMDHSLGWQGGSVPEDRNEAGVRCCSGRRVDLTCLPPAFGWDWGSKSENDLVPGSLGAGKDRQEVRTLTSCLRVLVGPSVLRSSQGWQRAWCCLPGGSAGRVCVWGLHQYLPFSLPCCPSVQCPRGNQVDTALSHP